MDLFPSAVDQQTQTQRELPNFITDFIIYKISSYSRMKFKGIISDCKYTHKHTLTDTYSHTLISHTHTHTHTHTSSHKNNNTHTHTHTDTHTHTHTHTHTYPHTYIPTDTQ